MLAGIAGCESAQQKCDKARDAAASAWGGYVAALEQLHKTATATRSEVQRKLGHEIELRLSPLAQKVADSRYERSDEAWRRAHTTAFHDACKRDAECSALKQKDLEAAETLTDLSDRLPLATAALAAVRGPADAAKAAADAAVVHPEYPQLKQAQLLTGEAVERCKDLPVVEE